MKATNNAQGTEPTNNHENASTWQEYIIEELSDEAQASVSGGVWWRVISADPNKSITAEDYYKFAGFWGG
jgi:hypothetical protein